VTEPLLEDLVGAEVVVVVEIGTPLVPHDGIAVTEMIDAVETAEIVMTAADGPAVIAPARETVGEVIAHVVEAMTERNAKEKLLAAANV